MNIGEKGIKFLIGGDTAIKIALSPTHIFYGEIMKAKPMKCLLDKNIIPNGKYIHQKKIQGSRIEIDKGVFRTRHSTYPVNFKYPEIVKEISEFCEKWETSVIDGELAVLDNNGVPQLNLMESRTGLSDSFKIKLATIEKPVVFYVFDMPEFDNLNLRNFRLDERAIDKKSYLQRHCKETDRIKFLKWCDDGDSLFRKYTAIGGEGIVSKRVDSPYINNYRGIYWLKRKRHMDNVDCTIIGVTKKDALILMLNGKYHGKVYPVNGHDMFYPKQLAERLKKYETYDSVVGVPSSVRNETKFWIKPEIIAEVSFFEGNINPVFQRIRTD